MIWQFVHALEGSLQPAMLFMVLSMLMVAQLQQDDGQFSVEQRDMLTHRFRRYRAVGLAVGLIAALVMATLRTLVILRRRSYVNLPTLVLCVLVDVAVLVVLAGHWRSLRGRSKGTAGGTAVSTAVSTERQIRKIILLQNLAAVAIAAISFFAMQDVLLQLSAWVEEGQSAFTSAMLMRSLGFVLGIGAAVLVAGICASLRHIQVQRSFTLACLAFMVIVLIRHASTLTALLMSMRIMVLHGTAFRVLIMLRNADFWLNVGQALVFALPALACIGAGWKMQRQLSGALVAAGNAGVPGNARTATAAGAPGDAGMATSPGMAATSGMTAPTAHPGLLPGLTMLGVSAESLNVAGFRKLKAYRRKAYAVGLCCLIMMTACLATLVAGERHIHYVPELSPPEPYSLSQGVATISFDQVSDGHLHRFEYKAKDGVVMRFIIIKKQGGAYGIGLDACETCGDAGYFERDGKIICKRCNVAINVATIGFKGGCNPIPFPYTAANGSISIQTSDLDALSSHFT